MMFQGNDNINNYNNGWEFSAGMALPRWTGFEEKLFELALVFFPEDFPERWRVIADFFPGKTADDLRAHYDELVHDLSEIDAGRVELPSYVNDEDEDELCRWVNELSASPISFESGRVKRNEGKRKKGTPWTEEEHRRFLIGLKKYGKGDWRSISRNVVVTRTSTQVASHAQKFFLRQNSKKEKRRNSIHDITTATETAPAPATGPVPAPSLVPAPPLFYDFPDQGVLPGFERF